MIYSTLRLYLSSRYVITDRCVSYFNSPLEIKWTKRNFSFQDLLSNITLDLKDQSPYKNTFMTQHLPLWSNKIFNNQYCISDREFIILENVALQSKYWGELLIVSVLTGNTLPVLEKFFYFSEMDAAFYHRLLCRNQNGELTNPQNNCGRNNNGGDRCGQFMNIAGETQ